jgi:hypothetical protein
MTNVTRSDCSGDYNNSFVYMLIAQFNYFIWPFIVLCVLNMLIMLNIWKRSRKMSRLRLFSKCAKSKEENIASSPYPTSKDAEDDQHLSTLSKHKRNSIELCPSIILEENENIVHSTSSNKTLPHSFNEKSSKNSQPSVTYLSSFIHSRSPIMYKYLSGSIYLLIVVFILEKIRREFIIQIEKWRKIAVNHHQWYISLENLLVLIILYHGIIAAIYLLNTKWTVKLKYQDML